VKGIQVCPNKEPCPLQWGDNHKNEKIGWGHLKIFFSRTTGLRLIRLLWGRGFKFIQTKGIALLQREIIVKE
jgi:hypothetical protein